MKFAKVISVISLGLLAPLVQAASVELTPSNVESLTGSGTW